MLVCAICGEPGASYSDGTVDGFKHPFCTIRSAIEESNVKEARDITWAIQYNLRRSGHAKAVVPLAGKKGSLHVMRVPSGRTRKYL